MATTWDLRSAIKLTTFLDYAVKIGRKVRESPLRETAHNVCFFVLFLFFCFVFVFVFLFLFLFLF